MAKYLGETGLVYLWSKIKTWVQNYVKITESGGTKTITIGTVSTNVYDKPSTGIPKTDLAQGVQNSLDNADSAYQKPSGGIPATDLTSSVQTALTNAANAIPSTQKGAAGGVAPLDANSKIDAQYLPSYVDDVIEAYARSGQTALSQNWLATGSASGTVIVPESGKIYVLMNSGGTDYPVNSQYRWGGTTYVQLSSGGLSEMTTSEMDTATNNWS